MGEQVVVEQNQNPFEPVELTPIELLDIFDCNKKELYEYLETVVQNGFEEYDDGRAMTAICHTAISFGKAASALSKTASDLDDAKSMVSQLWKLDDAERVNHFNSNVLKAEVLDLIDKNTLEEAISEVFADPDEIEKLAMEKYRAFLRTDSNSIIEKLYEKSDREDDYDVDIYENGPEALHLLEELEEVAFHEVPGYKEGYIDSVSLKKPLKTESDYFTEYTFTAQRDYFINKAGITEASVEYSVGFMKRYAYGGIEALPSYIRDFLYQHAEEGNLEFSSEELCEENNVFVLEYIYNVSAGDDGSCTPLNHVALKLEEVGLPLPNFVPKNNTKMSIEGHSQITDEEQKLFSKIFSERELVEIATVTTTGPNQTTEKDMIDVFRKEWADIRFATPAKHTEQARKFLKQFKQKKRQ